MTWLLVRNVCRRLPNINFLYKNVLQLQTQSRSSSWSSSCWGNAFKKIQSTTKKVTFCLVSTDQTGASTQEGGSCQTLLEIPRDHIIKSPDLVNVKTMYFNISEGGKYIVDFIKSSDASIVTIFVRTSVLANELVKELKEHYLNAVEITESSQVDYTRHESCIFVVSDKFSSSTSLPKSDLVIQVQAPLFGMDIMKERLRVSNFTNTLASMLLLYNNNDSQFISQLGEVTSLTTIVPPSFHTLQTDDEKQVTDYETQVNLPALNKYLEKRPAVSRKVKSSLFKPIYPEGRKSKNFSFVDKVRLYVIGGSGGNGSPCTGARGGDGGDVIIECQPKATLRHFRFKENRRPKASHGQHCCIRAKRVNGQRGSDLIIPVPLGIVIKDHVTGHVIADINQVGQRLKIASGGRGGSPSTFEGGGEKGERKMIVVEYKMQTDVGLVGFPNAGKSTLLRALSNAKPKVAQYPFTSLKPTLGRVQLEDFNQLTLADLPGLLEGAHKNKGLGLKFLRHVERAKVLLFVVDVTGFQLSNNHPKRTAVEAVGLLAKELVLYRENLVNKPKILVLNKMDCVECENEFIKIKNEISEGNFAEQILTIEDQSNINFEHIQLLKKIRFDYIIAASALKKTGVKEIVCKLQETMVRHAESSNIQL